MSQSIISRVIGAQTDQRCALANGQISRVLAVTSSWTRIRVGIQFCISNVATIVGNPVLSIGMTAGTANGFGDTSTTHFIGWRSAATGSFTFNAGPPAYNQTSAAINLCKKVLTVITSAASVSVMYFSAAPTSVRSVMICEIIKGSPNFTIESACATTSAGGQADVNDSNFLNMMELGNLSTIGSVVSGYTSSGPVGTAIDESTNGFFTAFNCFWDRTSAPLEISAVRVKKLA